MYRPKMAQVYEYVDLLFESLKKPDLCEIRLVQNEKFLNFVGLSICPKGEFLHYEKSRHLMNYFRCAISI